MEQSQGTVTITHPFGTLDVSRESLLSFPAGGPFGFEGVREFALLPAARDGLWWLMSLTDPPVTFVLGDPFVAFSDYEVDLGSGDKTVLGIEQPDDALALVILTLPPEAGGTVTANLRAPLVINLATRVAAQIVSRDEGHRTAEPIELARYPLSTTGLQLG